MLTLFTPVSLDTLQQKNPLLERTDTKYIAQASELSHILGAFLPDYRILEIDNNHIFTYNSAYFDTKNMDFYLDHHQGKRQRKKIRTRHYADTDASFFEAKFKSKGKTIKKRIAIDNAHHGIHTEHTHNFINKHHQSLYNKPFEETIFPSLHIQYKRITLTDKDFIERVTFDFDFVFTNSFDPSQTPITHNNMLIIESKGDKFHNTSKQIIKSHGLQAQDSCSKYCIGANLVGLAPKSNNFKQVMKKVTGL